MDFTIPEAKEWFHRVPTSQKYCSKLSLSLTSPDLSTHWCICF
jgi:hypothetical protein